ncbi:MAG: hypothetical protein FP825_05300 [Hyphomonas sp.]|uniref:hypothetical protein n=1 Tax=Hyphomonas sp. TaxID=87 RepID=UPI0017F72390|nr:hypothetical protein [Hyphomonas sp.]MBA3067884.1 hypothetical protein [Hyphomonas sp.]MBU3921601.1 hypothetical protein [Alphaproteobacteria bacterium]MBU4062440.1 hypothetical protein [Alphaproteobacteria bacterium]MBU4165951.1 hypothetical protein [Alphaproteobacteria bacterium]
MTDILEREQELLKAGRAGEAASLVEEKMIALQRFESLLETAGLTGVSHKTRRAMERVIQLAEQNAVHMEAIRNGIRHAISRLENLNGSVQVGSYGRGGAQLSFSKATGTFNRRA